MRRSVRLPPEGAIELISVLVLPDKLQNDAVPGLWLLPMGSVPGLWYRLELAIGNMRRQQPHQRRRGEEVGVADEHERWYP